MKGTGFWYKTATKILRRDSYTCVYCGGVANVVDHVVPRSKDGPTTTANGVACCTHCNIRKGGKLSEEYLVKGLVHLVRVGEDIGWVDNLYSDRLYRMSRTLEYAVRILLQSEISRSDISFILDISEEMIEDFERDYL